ncbi:MULTISPECIES: Rieske 2Fe-2S domain-containing protein [Sorangium]|uniref:Rieske 2Fe-2S domain-containing protein n=1 Tax=Sorangium TaxID=39643 RepID=UPI003D9C3D78
MPASKLGRKPVRVVLAGNAYALFRDEQGRPAALADACPHRLAPLSQGRVRPDGRLECPYHGWHFDAEGRGACPSQPSLTRCDTRSFQLVEQLGYLWLAHRDTPRSALPELDFSSDGFEYAGTFSHLAPAPLHVIFDNSSEDEHTPFVHGRLGWTPEDAARIDFSCDVFEDRTEVKYSAPQRPSTLARLMLLQPGDTFHNQWVTRFSPVYTVYTSWWTAQNGMERPVVARAGIFFVPETERTTFVRAFLFVKITDPRFRPLLPVVKSAAIALSWKEIRDDVKFIPHVADTPFEMKGMRLNKYDATLVHNHRLMRSIYFGETRGEAEGTGVGHASA